MIDFVRFEFTGSSRKEFESRCQLLQELQDDLKKTFGIGILEQTHDMFTSEIKDYPINMEIHNMKIKITPKIARLEGSLHKLNNLRTIGVNQNFNPFTKSKIVENLEFLKNLFPSIPSAKITCLEFGLNIMSPIPSGIIITERLHLHKKKSPYIAESSIRRIYKEFSYKEYDLKIYDKARQYRHIGSVGEILRFELRLRNRVLRKNNIMRITDLENSENLKILFNTYLKRFNELVILDDYHNSSISEGVKNSIDKYVSESYWRRLQKNKHPQAIKREREKIEKLIQEHSLDNTKKQIERLLINQFQQLLNT